MKVKRLKKVANQPGRRRWHQHVSQVQRDGECPWSPGVAGQLELGNDTRGLEGPADELKGTARIIRAAVAEDEGIPSPTMAMLAELDSWLCVVVTNQDHASIGEPRPPAPEKG